MRVIVAADPRGADLAKAVVQHLRSHHAQDVEVEDRGTGGKYYEVAREVAAAIEAAAASGADDRAVLCCGSGQGMSIISNKFSRVYAALCTSPEAAAGSRSVNNSNVLCMGGSLTSAEEGCRIVDAWLRTELAEGWEPDVQQFIRDSMPAIAQLEYTAAMAPAAGPASAAGKST